MMGCDLHRVFLGVVRLVEDRPHHIRQQRYSPLMELLGMQRGGDVLAMAISGSPGKRLVEHSQVSPSGLTIGFVSSLVSYVSCVAIRGARREESFIENEPNFPGWGGYGGGLRQAPRGRGYLGWLDIGAQESASPKYSK